MAKDAIDEAYRTYSRVVDPSLHAGAMASKAQRSSCSMAVSLKKNRAHSLTLRMD